jgi:hypothetical protein
MKGIRTIGAWAAATIMIQPDARNFESLIRPKNTPGSYVVAGRIKHGRVIAIGDSSPFDDGSGDIEKNRHNSYNSWLYDHPRLAVQSIAWLLNRAPSVIPQKEIPFPQTFSKSDHQKYKVLIDAAHGNNEADNLSAFISDLRSELNCAVAINTRNPLKIFKCDLLVMTNPSMELQDDEITAIARWIRKSGGSCLITANNVRNPLNGIETLNHLLERMDSRMRICSNEVLDSENNTGKPWSVVAGSFLDHPLFSAIKKVVFFGAGSLCSSIEISSETATGPRLIAATFPTARLISSAKDRSDERKSAAGSIPLAAFEQIGKGRIIVLGANTLSDFQYTDRSEISKDDQKKREHQTPAFNIALVRYLQK